MNWKYCVIRDVKPARVKNPVGIDPLAAVKRRLRKRLMSSIGWSMPRSTLTKIARMANPPAIVATVAPEPHPQFGPWMMPSTRAAMPALESTTPRQSMGGAEGSLDVGTTDAITAAMTAATGAMNRNTLPHQNCPSSHPPMIGPAATPTPVVAPHRPIALAHYDRSVNTLAISDSVDGKIAAAPRPITARAAMSWPGFCPNAPARLAAPNTPSPASRT